MLYLTNAAFVPQIVQSADYFMSLEEFNTRHPSLSECLPEFPSNHAKLKSLENSSLWELLKASYTNDSRVKLPISAISCEIQAKVATFENVSNEMRSEYFSFSLSDLVEEFQNIMEKHGFAPTDESTLDILLVISSCGLLLETTDYAKELLSSSPSNGLSSMEYLASLYQPIIENFLLDVPMIHRRIPHFSVPKTLDENILKEFEKLYLEISKGFVDYKGSVFQKIWSEEEYFRFLKSVPLPTIYTSAYLGGIFKSNQSFIDSFEEGEFISASSVRCFNGIDSAVPLKLVDSLDLIIQDPKKYNFQNVDLNALKRLSVKSCGESHLQPSLLEDLFGRIGNDCAVALDFSNGLKHLVDLLCRFQSKGKLLDLSLTLGDDSILGFAIPEIRLSVKSLSVPSLAACRSLKIFEDVKELKLSYMISDLHELSESDLSDCDVQKLSITISKPSYNLTDLIIEIIKIFKNLFHLKIHSVSAHNAGNGFSQYDSMEIGSMQNIPHDLILEFDENAQGFVNLMDALAESNFPLVIWTKFKTSELRLKYPNLKFGSDEDILFAKTKVASGIFESHQ